MIVCRNVKIYLGPGRHDSERCVVVDDDALLAGARRLWLLGGGVSAALSDIALTLTSPREGWVPWSISRMCA